jgi:hypothetical protein
MSERNFPHDESRKLEKELKKDSSEEQKDEVGTT